MSTLTITPAQFAAVSEWIDPRVPLAPPVELEEVDEPAGAIRVTQGDDHTVFDRAGEEA